MFSFLKKSSDVQNIQNLGGPRFARGSKISLWALSKNDIFNRQTQQSEVLFYFSKFFYAYFCDVLSLTILRIEFLLTLKSTMFLWSIILWFFFVIWFQMADQFSFFPNVFLRRKSLMTTRKLSSSKISWEVKYVFPVKYLLLKTVTYFENLLFDDQQLHIISYPCRNFFQKVAEMCLIVPVVIYFGWSVFFIIWVFLKHYTTTNCHSAVRMFF